MNSNLKSLEQQKIYLPKTKWECYSFLLSLLCNSDFLRQFLCITPHNGIWEVITLSLFMIPQELQKASFKFAGEKVE